MDNPQLETVLSLAAAFIVNGNIATLCNAEQGDVAAGKVTYGQVGAMCHGETGKGDGPTAAVLNPKPRDQTNGREMNGLKDDYLFIKEGGASVGKPQLMPSWSTQTAAKAASKAATKPLSASQLKP